MNSEKSTLQQKVDEIEQKRRDYERSEELEDAVEQADSRLQRHNDRMSNLEDDVHELVHRNTVVTDVYERKEAQTVSTARTRLGDVVETTQEDVLDLLDEGDIASEGETVRNVESVVESAVDDTKDRLSTVQNKWISRVSTTESILRIIGGDEGTNKLLRDIERFVRREAWKLSNETASLEKEWDGLVAKWGGIEPIDWHSFKKRHSLSDETIDLLKKLADDTNPQLSSTRADVVEELFGVESLRQNIELTI